MLKRFGALAAALAVGGMLAMSGTAMAAKGFKHLSFMGSYLEKHPTVVNYWEPYFKATDEKIGGKLTFDYLRPSPTAAWTSACFVPPCIPASTTC